MFYSKFPCIYQHGHTYKVIEYQNIDGFMFFTIYFLSSEVAKNAYRLNLESLYTKIGVRYLLNTKKAMSIRKILEEHF
jgi:hypothetical protein